MKNDTKTADTTDDIELGVVDIEEYSKKGQKPPKAKRYQIRIDKEKHTVAVSSMTGRELYSCRKNSGYELYDFTKLRGGEAPEIGLDESVDFTAPGVERFMTLKLNHTDGGC